MKRGFIALLLLLLAADGLADDAAKKARTDRLVKIARGETATTPPNAADPAAPEAVPASADAKTRTLYQAAMQEYYAYRIDGLRHRRDVFRWQLFSSKVIFVVVILLVLAGIYFAAVQFHAGLGKKKAEAVTELVANLEGIKVSSPVLGVIILVISLAFFYCYLVFVYPISEIL